MLEGISTSLTDIIVYLAIGLVFIVGLSKCVFPVRRAARKLRRGIRDLENDTISGQNTRIWQENDFLGKQLQGTWTRFLHNAKELDARGMTCDIEKYINDDTVICSVGHVSLADIIPGLLTSLGILGTFIGLIRGLGGLDVSDAEKTMESIPAMIGGMTFAFSTSIVGVACSLLFNIFSRMAQGSAASSIDEFNETFTDLIMAHPLDDEVQLFCQQRDRDVFLHRFSNDMGVALSGSVRDAVEQSLLPISQTINQFVMGQTQSQIDGIALISQQFVMQMNRALGMQFQQLSDSLSLANQQENINMQSMQSAMQTASELINNMQRMESGAEQVARRFESFIQTADENQKSSESFLLHSSQVLTGMLNAGDEQLALLEKIRQQQNDLQNALQGFSVGVQQITPALSGLSIEKECTAFAEKVQKALDVSIENFSDSVNKVLKLLDERSRENALEKDGTHAAEQTEIQKLLGEIAVLLQEMNAKTDSRQ